MDTLIIYYSHSGNNEKLAKELHKRLSCDIYALKELKKRKTISILFDFMFNRQCRLADYNINLLDYQNIILVSPVWGSKAATPIWTFIHKEKGKFQKVKNIFFISICNGGIGQKVKLINDFTALLKKKPTEIKELWVNNLLPIEKQYKIKYVLNFRINDEHMNMFAPELENFIKSVKAR